MNEISKKSSIDKKVTPIENLQIGFKQSVIQCISRYLENLNQYMTLKHKLRELTNYIIFHNKNDRKVEKESDLFKIVFKFPSEIGGTEMKFNIDLQFIENLDTFISSDMTRLKKRLKSDIEDENFKETMTYFPEESDDINSER